MDRAEYHRLARILEGPSYNGGLIESLVEKVEEAEALRETRIAVIDTPSEWAGSALEADNCDECHAAYGHKIWCSRLTSAMN